MRESCTSINPSDTAGMHGPTSDHGPTGAEILSTSVVEHNGPDAVLEGEYRIPSQAFRIPHRSATSGTSSSLESRLENLLLEQG